MVNNRNRKDQSSTDVSRRVKAGALTITGVGAAPAASSTALALHGHLTLSFLSAFLLPILLLAFVICPAIWSRKEERRKAALEVLDRLLGRHNVETGNTFRFGNGKIGGVGVSVLRA